MYKKELAVKISQQTGIPQYQVLKVIDTYSQIVMDSLCNNEEVIIRGFGKFKNHRWTGRLTNSPLHPDRPMIYAPSRMLPMFVPSIVFKSAVVHATYDGDRKSEVYEGVYYHKPTVDE